ncbi:MAG: type I-U CRISPR-associated helicase/endonuclease Cas3 [Myxococcales bacterium]|nr:type I-U CRISPR-associated helicase/endonuclease Cas3 [Myxococcales bacterium]
MKQTPGDQLQMGFDAPAMNASDALLADALGLKDAERPFPWQRRLLDRFLRNEPPRALDLPTGSGKTSAMAIWLLARALGAALPRRLVYIVDRRVVVDQATKEATRLRAWLARHPNLAQRLGLGDRPLPISTLRGQFVDNRAWLEDPSATSIVLGTVDMVGSRLLFRGYSTSAKMRPFHAGLLGHDAFFMLDEAHLVPPFERLLEQVVASGGPLRPEGDGALGRPPAVGLLSLSATGSRPADSARTGAAFELDEADHGDPIIDRRMRAPKALRWEALPPKASLADRLVQEAWALAGEGALPIRCIIFTARRDDAEKAFKAMQKLAGVGRGKKGTPEPADLELLVGARRVFERTGSAERLETLGFMAGGATRPERPAFLFATSAGEVGVDLDADHMVCDLVPWERMVQRLGRVNRRGLGSAQVRIFGEAPPDDSREAAVVELLRALPRLADGDFDGSPNALTGLQRAARRDPTLAERVEAATTPPPLFPPLLRPTLDAWSLTSLGDDPGRPEVAPWLRGWTEHRPQVTIVWRRMLPVPQGRPPAASVLARYLEAAPDHASERMEVDTRGAADWLRKRVAACRKRIVKSADGIDAVSGLRDESLVVLIQDGRDARPTMLRLDAIAEMSATEVGRQVVGGATLFVDARLAGLSEGLLDDRAEVAPATADGDVWLEHADETPPPVRFRLRRTGDPSSVQDPKWRERERLPMAWGADGAATEWLVVDKWLHDAATEEDRSAGRPQALSEHQDWASAWALRLGQRLGLPPAGIEVLTTAAMLHDEGKRAARWQQASSAPADGPFAKTLGPFNVHRLDGYRHEFGSLPYAEASPALAHLSAEHRDLVLHLIAAHHGYARPLISTRGCADAPPSALRERAQAVALRFARLQQRWGPWGLAWWEAVLRASDVLASRDNDAPEHRLRAEDV